ncbi:MAG: hypothetical protein HY898_14775 [Deltaproteobacteria bacterium]|nr:hypothetical protein [Deltaproteobacteria bacterium]
MTRCSSPTLLPWRWKAVVRGMVAACTVSTLAHGDARECIAVHERALEQRNKGHLTEAEPGFATCARSPCPPIIRSECVRLLEDVRRNLPTIVIAAVDASGADVVDASVWIDGSKVAERLGAEATPIDPGQHEVELRRADGTHQRTSILVREGEKVRRIQLRFAPVAGKAPVSPPSPGKPGIMLPLALAGVGVLAGGLFAVLAASGKSEESRLDRECSPACSAEDVDRVRTRYLFADISLGVSLLSFAGAAWTYWGQSSDSSAPSTRQGPVSSGLPGPSTWSVSVQGSF